MAFDAELQIVSSVTVDISVSATPASTTPFVLGRRGLVKKARFAVIFEDVSADTAIDPIHFYLEVSVDSGSTWHRIADIQLNGDGAASKRGPYSVPISGIDLRDETRTVNAVQLRVTVVMAATGGADDFTYSAYITGDAQFPPFNQ